MRLKPERDHRRNEKALYVSAFLKKTTVLKQSISRIHLALGFANYVAKPGWKQDVTLEG